MVKNEPVLYIFFQNEGKQGKLGPFYTATPDGQCYREWQSYIVQTEKKNFVKITVPWQHDIRGMISKDIIS